MDFGIFKGSFSGGEVGFGKRNGRIIHLPIFQIIQRQLRLCQTVFGLINLQSSINNHLL